MTWEAQRDAQVGGTTECKMGAAEDNLHRPSRKGTAQSWGARVRGVAHRVPRSETKGPGCRNREGAQICGALIYNLESLGKPSSLPLFYSSCVFNYFWVERRFSEASPSHEVDVAYAQRLPPSWCISRKLLLAVPGLICFSDRVSRSTKHTLGRHSVCASGCNKELDSSWCGGSAQWATGRKLVGFFLLPEFKSQQHMGSWL